MLLAKSLVKNPRMGVDLLIGEAKNLPTISLSALNSPS